MKSSLKLVHRLALSPTSLHHLGLWSGFCTLVHIHLLYSPAHQEGILKIGVREKAKDFVQEFWRDFKSHFHSLFKLASSYKMIIDDHISIVCTLSSSPQYQEDSPSTTRICPSSSCRHAPSLLLVKIRNCKPLLS